MQITYILQGNQHNQINCFIKKQRRKEKKQADHTRLRAAAEMETVHRL
jgi:hypothetical protein